MRHALRSLFKTPGFTLVAILTLGLGIGANTSMFSLVNGVLLRPLPFGESAQLDRLFRSTIPNPNGGVSPADYLDLASQATGYGEVAAYALADFSLAAPGQPADLAPGLRVSANFFSTLRSTPHLGRDFHPADDQFGHHRVVILSHRSWKNRFGGDPRIVGRTVRIDGEPHEVVGVLPATFNDWRYLGWVDLFRPLALTPTETPDRTSTSLRLVGRRNPALPAAQSAEAIAAFGRRLAADFPAIHAATTWRTTPLNTLVSGENGPALFAMLLGLSGFVLLIACSNLANLLLARTMARAREFAVRSALGATRAQLLRPLLLESLLLAFAGGLCALVVALWTSDWLAVRSTGDNGEQVVLALDRAVLAWAFLAALVTALAFSLAPALFALRLDPLATLKRGGRGTTGDRGHRRFRSTLIVGQFALALVLLTGAALFVTGLDELNARRVGWNSARVVAGSFALPATTYPDAESIAAFQRLALERLAALPGVESVSLSSALPFLGFAETRRYVVAGQPTPAPGREPVAALNTVSSDYFATVGTRLLHGRTFDATDTAASPRTFVINQAMARALFGAENPLGRRLARAGAATPTPAWGEIVGVVADTASVYPDQRPITSQLYQPLSQEPRLAYELAVRATAAAPATLVAAIRTTIASLNPDLPVRQLQPADTTILRANYQWGVLASMLTWLALLGLALAALGIFGVIARTMAERTAEFGIRLALGAQLEDITGLVLRSGLKLALLGAAIGLLGSVGLAQLLAANFPGLHLQSVPVVVGVTVLLIGIALLACWLPARRAARLDPLTALRTE
jgi:predicted permease